MSDLVHGEKNNMFSHIKEAKALITSMNIKYEKLMKTKYNFCLVYENPLPQMTISTNSSTTVDVFNHTFE